MVKIDEHTWDDYNQLDNVEQFCDNYIATADVASNSEVEALKEKLDATIAGQETLQKALVNAKSEVEKIFEEIGEWLVKEYVPYIRGYSNSLSRSFAELKKKYTEGKNDT